MKMKSLAMVAMSGLLVASFAYVAPAMADDMNEGSGQSMQQPAPSDNSSMGSGMSSGGDSSSMDNGSSSSDQGSPDTATGDDDY